MPLVPRGGSVEAEVEVSAEDIGFVREGDPARVKIDAFPFQKHGVVTGRVVVISPDSFVSGQPNAAGERSVTRAYYQVRIDNLVSALRAVPKDFQLLPGMTVVAEIKVSERSVMSYLSYPLIKTFDESMREP
jgi:hemolysin D